MVTKFVVGGRYRWTTKPEIWTCKFKTGETDGFGNEEWEIVCDGVGRTEFIMVPHMWTAADLFVQWVHEVREEPYGE
jgi:hypothetical protein